MRNRSDDLVAVSCVVDSMECIQKRVYHLVHNMVEGRVTRLVHNLRGDVEGWKLEGNVYVHFHPHFGAELGEWIAVGDRVVAEGEWFTHPDGFEVLLANWIESQGWTMEIGEPNEHRSHDHATPEDIMRELRAIRNLLEDER